MNTMTTIELNNDEKALLAREVAADSHVVGGGWYNDSAREVFISGWNAAMEYASRKASDSIAHLDSDDG